MTGTSEVRPPTIRYRPMTKGDVGHVPISCQGSKEDIDKRLEDLESCAILGFDNDKHVAQLQFRRFDPSLRSPNGLWDPIYWGDFGENAPCLPHDSLSIFCYHVGQLDDTDQREPSYHGCGIGLSLLDYFVDWSEAHDFHAIAAKFVPPVREVMSFMGGQPLEVYLERDFEQRSQWIDKQLQEVLIEKNLVAEGSNLVEAATVGCCVKYLSNR